MKRIIICLIGLAASLPQVFAQSQVNYSAAPGFRMIDTAGSQPVADGNAVWIGMFNPGFNVAANAVDPSALIANWITWDSTSITTLAGQSGRFSDSFSRNDPTFNDQKIYLWIFSTDSATAPLPDFSNVNEYGLYSSTNAQWTFLPNNSPPLSNTRNINTTQVSAGQNFYGSFDATHLYLQNFNPVPEPSTISLLCLAIPAVVLALRKARTPR